MSIGIWQLVLILLIVLLVFGAGKLPRVMGDVGKGVRSMREGLKGEGEGQTADASAKKLSKQDDSNPTQS
jgi:sec-independent protein translocase protein TatA